MPFLEVMLSFLGERLLLGSSVGYFGMVLFACSFLSFLCEKRVGSSFSFERGRREVVVLGGVCWLASTAEQELWRSGCPNPTGLIF
jgi:hypothetical protein